MPDAGMLKVDNRNYRLNGRLLKRILTLMKPFWLRREAWPYWIAMGTLVSLAPIGSLVLAYNSKVIADMTNRIIARDASGYWPILMIFLGVITLKSLIDIAMQLVEGRLVLRWRQWMTINMVDQYMAKRTYYDISLTNDLDNPDQRIQESVGSFTQIIIKLPQIFLGQITSMLAGVAILATIDLKLLIFVVAYTVIHSLVMFYVYVPTVRQNFQMTVAEADLRYGLVHVREHAETVAFYRGERSEQDQIVTRLGAAVNRTMTVIMYGVFVTSVGSAFEIAWTAMPYLLLVPSFFAHHIQFGSIAQATYAALQVQLALNLVVNNLPFLSSLAPQAVRLAEIQERFQAMDRERRDIAVPRLLLQLGPEIRLEHVSLQTPGGEQALVQDIAFTLRPGENLVIVGQTGVGKSSLLRAMAGLWTRGSGTITMPLPTRCLFLPQRPYMVLGDLRAQLTYPNARQHSDEELNAILDQVNLPGLVAKHGGLDAVRDWGTLLSIGEQQRIGFARVLAARPEYVFLDEATSGVDYATEKRLYASLAAIGCTYVSIGHRASILDHHARALRLLPGGSWQLESIADAIAHDEAVLAVNQPVTTGA